MAIGLPPTPTSPPPIKEEQATKITVQGMALDLLAPSAMKFSAEPMDGLKEGEDDEDFLSPPPIPFEG